MNEIYSDNLFIKKPSTNNLNSLISNLNNWNIVKWLINVPYPYNIDDALEWLEITKREELCLNIFLKKKLIGGISIASKGINTNFDLGYWISEDYWGRGYALEASKLLIAHFFSNTSQNKIYSGHIINNKKSKKILETLGFVKISEGKVFSLSKQKKVDHVYYELIKS